VFDRATLVVMRPAHGGFWMRDSETDRKLGGSFELEVENVRRFVDDLEDVSEVLLLSKNVVVTHGIPFGPLDAFRFKSDVGGVESDVGFSVTRKKRAEGETENPARFRLVRLRNEIDARRTRHALAPFAEAIHRRVLVPVAELVHRHFENLRLLLSLGMSGRERGQKRDRNDEGKALFHRYFFEGLM